ncbi:hypothetical protein [Lyngbya sp. CCY1209]|uniref:hypothetical protein n=1 Tax=Lyngbya sp. CCY1209 TaxID=2886103 RepID=UPI002D2099E9|nr:hypothetical protein [Lyngbya sp. CCY1209]MEB3883980.1 hypothetical protein [Lyngbya sp. CCY1209]
MKYQAQLFATIALILGSFGSPVLAETAARSPSELNPKFESELPGFPISIINCATESENTPERPDRGEGRR